MDLNLGKTYATRDGKRTGPLTANNNPLYPFLAEIGQKIVVFTSEGRFAHEKHGGGENPLDLVRELEDRRP